MIDENELLALAGQAINFVSITDDAYGLGKTMDITGYAEVLRKALEAEREAGQPKHVTNDKDLHIVFDVLHMVQAEAPNSFVGQAMNAKEALERYVTKINQFAAECLDEDHRKKLMGKTQSTCMWGFPSKEQAE